MELNKFIDYSEIFRFLYLEHEQELKDHRFEAKHFDELINFYENGCFESFIIQEEECDITDKEISFVFGLEFGGANESTNYIASADYYIVYDRILKEFTSCEYEQG